MALHEREQAQVSIVGVRNLLRLLGPGAGAQNSVELCLRDGGSVHGGLCRATGTGAASGFRGAWRRGASSPHLDILEVLGRYAPLHADALLHPVFLKLILLQVNGAEWAGRRPEHGLHVLRRGLLGHGAEADVLGDEVKLVGGHLEGRARPHRRILVHVALVVRHAQEVRVLVEGDDQSGYVEAVSPETGVEIGLELED